MTPVSCTSRRRTWIYAAAIVAAGAVSYANSLNCGFVFDDVQYVAHNEALRHLWPPFGWLGFCPTRPVVYFTFAVNYAMHGNDVVGFHLVNIAIHLAVALGLLGLIRRTLVLPCIAERYRKAADELAAATALVWVVHPLCTQAVTYVYQRLESLASLFAVAAIYGVVRAYRNISRPQRAWQAASITACWLGILSKESVFALPMIVLVYDRLYLAGSWRAVLARRRFHAAMFCSWGVAVGLMIASGEDYEKAGIADGAGVAPLSYALSESGVILHYLRLAFVPVGLCLDYYWPIAQRWTEFVPQTIVVLLLLGVTFVGLIRARLWSFPAVAFFLLLAPTSSIVPIADLAFEHRMYLPLACVIALVVCGVFELTQMRWVTVDAARTRQVRFLSSSTLIVVVVALAAGTIDRNRDYLDGPTMWRDCVAKAPSNPRPCDLLAAHYLRIHDVVEGRQWLIEALRLEPNFITSQLRLADLLIDEGRFDEAELLLNQVAMQRLTRTERYFITLGKFYAARGRTVEAIAAFENVLTTGRAFQTQARTNIGVMLDRLGRREEALAELNAAVESDAENVAAWINLGSALARRGQLTEAARAFERAVELDPRSPSAQENLAQVQLDLKSQEHGTTAILAKP